jgi:hypothetical protein
MTKIKAKNRKRAAAIRSTAGLAAPGYHFCSRRRCKTQMSDGSPELCPKHQDNSCPACGGREQVLKVWHHGHMPRMMKCPACDGTGKKTAKSEAFAIKSELVRKSALHETAQLLEIFPDESRLQKLHRILANNHPNGTFQGATENLCAANARISDGGHETLKFN